MKKGVSASEKRSFLKWFLENERLKRPEARKVIDYILSRHNLVDQLAFTEEINIKERTIILSSINSDEPGFIFYFSNRKTEDVSRAMGEIVSDPFVPINIILHFYRKESNYRYINLLENRAKDLPQKYAQWEEYTKETDALIDKLLLERQRDELLTKIDLALDRRDQEAFFQYIEELNQLDAAATKEDPDKS